MRQRLLVCAAVLIVVTLPEVARADFIPGRLYVSSIPSSIPRKVGDLQGRIFEFDPATGESSEFFVLPPELGRGITGLAFAPDGARLRASVINSNLILEIDGDGNAEIALDSSDGISGAVGSNCLAYDAVGDFYVAGSPVMLRFPADGGPGSEFADTISYGAIAPHLGGGVYFAGVTNAIYLYPAPGVGGIFDLTPNNVDSLTSDSTGRLFALGSDGLYRYTGDAGTRHFLAPIARVFADLQAITMSADESRVYVVNGWDVLSIDAQTGAMMDHGSLPFVAWGSYFLVPGAGMALYIPEPASFALVLGGAVLVCVPPRSGALRWSRSN